jgi:hypothetical protein
MSTLIFDGTKHTLTLFDKKGHQVGQWPANNVVASKLRLRFVPNRSYHIIDRTFPHKHGDSKDDKKIKMDSIDGAYGPFGIIRMQSFSVAGEKHEGVGIHSGRAHKGSWNHPTGGCIRTTDQAMQAIKQHMLKDPLDSIFVQGNHEQNRLRHLPADHHPKPGQLKPGSPEGHEEKKKIEDPPDRRGPYLA